MIDPFGSVPDPESYVPRPASEAVLTTLVSFLGIGASPLVLQGPSGIGKTMMLRLVAARLESQLRVLYLPHPALPADEIAAWILGLMGDTAEAPGDDPDSRLVQLASELGKRGSGLLILVDDAASMPIETLQRLEALADSAQSALRILLTLPNDTRADGTIAALRSGVGIVPYLVAMNIDETASYVRARLAGSGLPPRTCAAFDDETVAAIHRESEGIPQLVDHAATRCLRAIQQDGEVDDAPLRSEEESAYRSEADSREVSPESEAEPEQELASAAELEPEPEPVRRRSRTAMAAVVVAAVIGVLALSFWAGRTSDRRIWSATPSERATDEGSTLSTLLASPMPESVPATDSSLHADPAGPSFGSVAPAALPQSATGGESVESGDSLAVVERADAPTAVTPPAAEPNAPTLAGERPPSSDEGRSRESRNSAKRRLIGVAVHAAVGAGIEVDGRKLGVAPIADVQLEPGAHWFRAILPNGRVIERVESIDAGRSSITLR